MKFSLAPDLLRLKRADVVLLALSFATAICDVATFNELGIFVSNQVSRFKTSFFSIFNIALIWQQAKTEQKWFARLETWCSWR